MGRFLWQSQRRPLAPSGRQALFSSSKRLKGCPAGVWRRLTGRVRGTSPSCRSRPKDRTASSPAILQGRFCVLATPRSSTRKTTKNKKLSSLRSAQAIPYNFKLAVDLSELWHRPQLPGEVSAEALRPFRPPARRLDSQVQPPTPHV